jgi:hypothetical protein
LYHYLEPRKQMDLNPYTKSPISGLKMGQI